MDRDEDVDRVWELIQKIGIAMLSTRDGEDIRARPMAAYVDRVEHAIYFLTDADSHKDEDIARSPHVGLAFADTAIRSTFRLPAAPPFRTTRARSRSSGQRRQRLGGPARIIRRSGF